jgi:DNA polymerase zeta
MVSLPHLSSVCPNIVDTGFEISDLISRAPSRHPGGGGDRWGMRQTSNFATNGRHVLNLWRIMRSELTLSMYSLENVAFNVLGKRFVRHGTLIVSILNMIFPECLDTVIRL